MSVSNVYIFSADAKPKAGGVAEFTHQIAKAVHDLGRLGAVITSQQQNGALPYPVYAPSPPEWLSENVDTKALGKLRAAWMWGALLRRGGNLAWQQAWGRQPILFVTYLDALFGPPILRFCEQTGIRLWILFHGLEIMQLQDQYPELLARAHRRADRFVFNSEATRELYTQRTGRRPQPSTILHPSLDFDKLESLDPEPLPVEIPEGSVVFSSVCRLVERKGLHRAVQAFREAKAEGLLEDAVYMIAGKGPEKERLRRIAGDQDGRSIFFLGYVSEGQKKTLFTKSDGFLHPNYSCEESDFEGFGISLVEAAWFGCAVLGGKQGGVSEAIGGLPGCEVRTMENKPQAVAQIRRFLWQVIEEKCSNNRKVTQTNIQKKINNKNDISNMLK
ncbi:glycosyltransferase family 4 protein [Salinibacter altiplanensis]|uniref:glycosyltransferase family 4 protein n=1 Tax=Salinibacter altiplanensis TaxID=1803181 RepID=UPI000C9FEE19|nr:glycosyltransferase family 4 protein [Salinibacter altiplanensis]